MLLGFLLAALAGSPQAHAGEWKFDTIHMKSGRQLKGLLQEETPDLVRFSRIEHRVGEPPRPIFAEISRSEIASIERLSPEERRALQALVKELQPATEEDRMQKLHLEPAPAACDIPGAQCYRSAFFLLVANVDDEILRRSAVRLEKIYQAYARYLPPRRPASQPTTILIVQPVTLYQTLLKARGRTFLNPAYYDCSRNEVLCACELQQLKEDLARACQQHREMRARLEEQRKLVERRFIGKVRKDRLEEIRQDLEAINLKDKQNESVFEKAAMRFYQILYHEAFHSYLANYVYAPSQTAVPHWLNEGLAQVFETAVVEGDELVVSRPDSHRLKQLRAGWKKNSLADLEMLLLSGPKDFQVSHASDQHISDEYYLVSWAAAYYLAFGCKKLGTPAMDQYVTCLKTGMNPVEAFKTLVQQPLSDFKAGLERCLNLPATPRQGPPSERGHL
jgi:Protein of unknown function (DUF1570)